MENWYFGTIFAPEEYTILYLTDYSHVNLRKFCKVIFAGASVTADDLSLSGAEY